MSPSHKDPIKMSFGYRVPISCHSPTLFHSRWYRIVCLAANRVAHWEWKILLLLLFGIIYCGHQSRLRDGERDSGRCEMFWCFFHPTRCTNAMTPLKCADSELLCRERERDDGWNWHTFIHLISIALGSGSVADVSDTAWRLNAQEGGVLYANAMFWHGTDDNMGSFLDSGLLLAFFLPVSNHWKL